MSDDKRGERRAETARRNDDSGIIEDPDEAPRHHGSSGGNLQRDIATQAEETRARDPEANEGPEKADDMAHGQRFETRHPAEHVVTKRD